MRITGAVLRSSPVARPYDQTRPLDVVPLDLDEPGPGELLIRLEAAGLCHSDLSVIDGNRLRPTPMLLGHEAAGIVERGGPGTRLSPGQRVVLTFLPRCGDCEGCATEGIRPCVPGSVANAEGSLLSGDGARVRRLFEEGVPIHHHLGVSAFATHCVASEISVVPVDPDVPADVASVLGCAVLTGGGAVLNVAQPQPGQRVAVVGLGGVGMAAVLTALAYPDVEVIAVDTLATKTALAAELGAHRTYLAADAVAAGVKADAVIECAGSVPAFETAVALTAPGGSTITVGLPAPQAVASVSPLSLVAEGRRIVGSYLGSAVPERDIPTFVALWRDGKLPVERLVSSHLSLDQINDGMEQLAQGSVLRQLITFPAQATHD